MKGGFTMKLSEKWYQILKYLCQIVLPAIGALYFSLAQIWNLPYSEQICGTIVCLCTFIGTILGISTYNYYKGE